MRMRAEPRACRLALAMLIALAGCSEEQAPAPPASVPARPASYALDAAKDTWPPMGEGVPMPAAHEGITASNYYVVLDGSGSMHERECADGAEKIEAAVSALNRFVAAVPADANLGLAVFDANGLSERVALGRGNREAFRAALAKVGADGSTPLRSAIALGYEQLLDQGRRQLGYGDYHLVVVTDGIADPASEDPGEQVQSILAETPVVLHTIGFCIGADHVLNQTGRSYYVAANTPEQLQQGLGAVLAEAPKFDLAQFKH